MSLIEPRTLPTNFGVSMFWLTKNGQSLATPPFNRLLEGSSVNRSPAYTGAFLFSSEAHPQLASHRLEEPSVNALMFE